MKRFKWICGFAVIIMVVAISMAAFAASPEKGKKGQNVSKDKPAKVSDGAKGVAELSLAAELAAYGRQAQNPMALLLAAQIMKNNPTQEGKIRKTSKDQAPAKEPKKEGSLNTPEKLLTEGKKMAEEKGMDQIAALIDKEMKVAATKGSPRGVQEIRGTVRAKGTDWYTNTFYAGEWAEVALVGDGACDLDLHVYDANNNIIRSSTNRGDVEYVKWAPKWTGVFKIAVQSNCGTWADYALATN